MKIRWRHDMAMIGNTIVGSVSKSASDVGYFAYGMMDEWEDTDLGHHIKQADAKEAVEEWVLAHGLEEK